MINSKIPVVETVIKDSGGDKMEIDQRASGQRIPLPKVRLTDLEPRKDDQIIDRIPSQTKLEVDKALDEKFNLIKYDVESKIKNLHVDLIRQFCQQENEVENFL